LRHADDLSGAARGVGIRDQRERRDFAFAMNVGVIVGTYSSIFIASPILIALNERFMASQRRQQKAPRRPQRGDDEPEGL
jgi:hypothetical protein